MANGTTSFWDYVYDSAEYISEQVSDAYKYVTSKDTYDFDFSSVGTGTSAERMKLLNRPSSRGTGGGGSAGKYDGGFLDYAGDAYEAGKKAVHWSGKVIKSDTFKETMAYINKLRVQGSGTPAGKLPLPQSVGQKRGGYKSGQFLGFGASKGKGGMPKSYGVIENIKNDQRIMERMNNEVSGVGAQSYGSNSRNLSSKAQLGAISVRNQYSGTRISSAKPAL